MEKNNFEKQVQEKLADLNIQPSEKAWTEIESRIGKKDRSKRILWFLLIGLFLLAGGGYLFLINGKSHDKRVSQLPKQNTEKVIQKSAVNQDNSSDPKIKNEQTPLNKRNQGTIQSADKSADTQSSSLKTIPSSEHKTAKNEMSVKVPVEKEKVNEKVEIMKSDIKQEEAAKEIDAVSRHNEISNIKTHSKVDSKTERAGVLAQNEIDTSSGNKVSIPDLLTQKGVNSEIKQELSSKENNAQDKTLKIGDNKNTSISTHKSWEIGVTFSAAKAYVGDGIHLGVELDKSNIVYDPQNSFNYSFSRPGSSVTQTPIGPASSPVNSYGFNAGVVLKKGISPKISFVSGLGYTYYTSSILIGDKLTGEKYSSAGMLSPYRNNVHFVNLPLEVQFHLNTNNKVPLNLSAGVNVSQLVVSNAVQYESGYYEVDNSKFTKTQFGFIAGFSATFFHNLSVGPFYQYGINPLAKEGLYGKKHLNFLGIKAEFIFRKNK